MELKKTKAHLWEGTPHLSEIYQSTGFKYAFLSSPKDGSKQCHGWIKCRDFLNDAVRNQIANRKDSIFGFSYNPGDNPPIDLSAMRMLVKRDVKEKGENIAAETKEMMLSAFSILRFFERHGKIKPITKLYTIADNPDIYIFVGASDWVLSPFMISLYTFLIRLGAKKISFKTKDELSSALKKVAELPHTYGDNDINYLKTVLPYIEKIIIKRNLLGFKTKDGAHLFEKAGIDTFHNNTGIVALCKPAVSLAELKSLSAEVIK
jgi:hypothetical protein